MAQGGPMDPMPLFLNSATGAITHRTIEELYDENERMVALALLYTDDWFLQHLLPMLSRRSPVGRRSDSHNTNITTITITTGARKYSCAKKNK